ncbi:MAG: hypothetical protein JWL70_2633, partial [Acidimicrobiia bacterium]|nr:hypothetical protein [Acidimicrobiia bacterium]
HLRDEAGLLRGAKALLHLNQAGGFDCSGCAWPEPADRSHFEFCENGVKALAEEATLRRVDAGFFAAHPVSELRARCDFWLGKQGRVTEPVYKPAGEDHYVPVDWSQAFKIVGDALRATEADRAVFYTSGRTSNEAAFLYQLFVRCLGTNNLPDCSNMCHESSGAALGDTVGLGKGTVSIEDFDDADLIWVIGQNPGTNHPRMLSSLERAKRRGAKIIAVNPLPEAGLTRFKNPQRVRGVVGSGTMLADLFLQIGLGADLALFSILNARLVAPDAPADAVDHRFIAEHCAGFEELKAHLGQLDLVALQQASGLSGEAIEQALAMQLKSKRTIICWAMGLTQHKASVPTIREIVNLLLLRGSIGRAGAGLCPVRGHSNVQGDRTMGIYEKPAAAFLDALEAEFGIVAPRRDGLDTVEAIRAMAAGEVDVFMGMGGNFLSAAPDTAATAAGMTRCRLTVQVSTKLNRSHVDCGEAALILPCLARSEEDRTGGRVQSITVEDSMSMVHASTGVLAPASADVRSEVSIVCGVAQATLVGSTVPWAEFERDYSLIRDRIARVIPGFKNFNQRLRESDAGFRLPHPANDGTFTGGGQARLSINQFVPIDIPAGHLLLQTVRSHDQYNTTIYGLDDRYRGISNGRRVVFVNPVDLHALGFADGDVVDVVGQRVDGQERRIEGFRLVSYPTARHSCAAYFPEANALVPLTSVAEGSNTPTSKSIVVRFERR